MRYTHNKQHNKK